MPHSVSQNRPGFGLRSILLALLLSLLMTAGSVFADSSAASDDERFTQLVAPVEADADDEGAQVSIEERSEVTVQRFRRLWSDESYGDGLAVATDEAVEFRLRAAETAMFYRQAPWILARFEAVLAEADARQIATASYYRKLFDAYLAADRFEDANALHTRYPSVELPPVPEVSEPPRDPAAGERVIWRVDGASGQMEGRILKMDKPRLVVVTSPGCGFCKLAAESLPDDEILGPLMREHALWLAGPSLSNTFHPIARWNDHYVDTPTFLVDNPGDWPGLDFERTPQFIFFDGGEIQGRLAGWTGELKSFQAIADGFVKLGLLDPDSIPEDAFPDVNESSTGRTCPERAEALDRIGELAPISTREDLEAHLAEIEAGADSPLTGLSEQGRQDWSTARDSEMARLPDFDWMT